MMAVGTWRTRSINCRKSHASTGPATTLPATANRNVGATALIEKLLCRHGADGEPVNQERAGVIQEALAFEDGQDAMRRSKPAKHGRCGRGVRRCDDGAERDRRRPWHFRDQRADDDGDGDGREADGEDHQAGDWRPVVLEVSGRCVVGRIEQDGCNEERQREFGRYGERRRARKKREERAAERQEYGIRCAGTTRRRRQENGGEEQANHSFEFPHVADAGRYRESSHSARDLVGSHKGRG